MACLPLYTSDLGRCGDIQGNQPQGGREQIVDNFEQTSRPPLSRCGRVRRAFSVRTSGGTASDSLPEGTDEEGVDDPDDGIKDEVALVICR